MEIEQLRRELAFKDFGDCVIEAVETNLTIDADGVAYVDQADYEKVMAEIKELVASFRKKLGG